MSQLVISEIFIYPIKSLPGISCSEAVVEERGFAGDRRYMLVDSQGKFISLREKPDFYQFNVSREGQDVLVRHPADAAGIRISPGNAGIQQQVQLWDDAILAYKTGSMVDEWFSDILGEKCSLVTFGKQSSRPISPPWGDGTEEVSFADGYPFLLVTRASLDDISSRTGRAMDVRRFRPNIVIDHGEPYEELAWDEIKIGNSTRLRGVKPCKRCVVTTIDPDTRAKGKEPLKALAGLHDRPAALFGQNAKMISAGPIATGDHVTVSKDNSIRLR